MLHSLKSIKGYVLGASDGEIGAVYDFFFDDQSWTVRYLVADTGKWLPGRLVLISPVSVESTDWSLGLVKTNLSCEQIENSPSMDEDQPVSRQHEIELRRYYGWPAYWAATPYPVTFPSAPPPGAPSTPPEEAGQQEKRPADPHLRSVREVRNYYVKAPDGEIGHMEDFIAEEADWIIRYLVVDTRNWWPGKKVLVNPEWIERVEWSKRAVYTEVLRETIKDAPEYDPFQPINREYEVKLYDFYGRPKYWT